MNLTFLPLFATISLLLPDKFMGHMKGLVLFQTVKLALSLPASDLLGLTWGDCVILTDSDIEFRKEHKF